MPPASYTVPKTPVVDTNVLFDFLVWRFHTQTQTSLRPSLLTHLSAKPLEALGWYLEAARPIQTSLHVIAEIHGLAKAKSGLTSPARESFWRFTREELFGLQLEERAVTISEMEAEDLALFGPTDASIMTLAIRLGSVVLTEDGGLRDRCTSREIGVLNYDGVLQLWKQSTQ